MKTLHVKTGDTVVILNGDDGPTRTSGNTGPAKYKRGKVLEVSPKENKVIVEGVNIVTKHVKPKKMGQAGGIVKAEAPMYASKVQLVCPSCDKATRVGHKFEGDKKLRLCKKCGETF